MTRIIALDANVIMLLVVGLTDKRWIEAHKRISYTVKDFETLVAIISKYDEIVVIPNALSEAANLLEYINEPARSQIFVRFRDFIENTREIYIGSTLAAARTEFVRLGVTDSALLELARENVFILSADGPLYRAALAAGYKAGHFYEVTEAGQLAQR
jgi:hypothetical protein